MPSHYTTANNNYIIVNNIFNDCIINLCVFRLFFGTPCIVNIKFKKYVRLAYMWVAAKRSVN